MVLATTTHKIKAKLTRCLSQHCGFKERIVGLMFEDANDYFLVLYVAQQG